MFDYVLDYQQRLVYQDELNLNELFLLFYFEKNIINEEFLKSKHPKLCKDFYFKTILSDLPILYIKRMQLYRLIKNLHNAGYIKAQGFYSGTTISITKKTILALSKKQFEEPARQKYLCLIEWTKKIYPKLLKNEQFDKENKEQTAQIWSVWNDYYNNYITTNPFNIKNNNINLDTKNVNSISSNKSDRKKDESFFEKLKPFFDKYPRFKVEKATPLPSDFNCRLLIEAMERSKFLQENERFDFKWLMTNYAKITTKSKNGKFTYDDYHQPAEKEKAFAGRDYDPEQLNSLFDNIDDINL